MAPSLSDQFKDNIAIFGAGLLITGFIAGWLAFHTVIDARSSHVDYLGQFIKNPAPPNAQNCPADAKKADTPKRQSADNDGMSAQDLVLLHKLQEFSQTTPDEHTTYTAAEYITDAGNLERYGLDFADLLESERPQYRATTAIYTALGEAADDLGIRGMRMHGSGQATGDFAEHVFVGPGWFRYDLELLRAAQIERKGRPLDDNQIKNFRWCMSGWKSYYSGTGDSKANPGICRI